MNNHCPNCGQVMPTPSGVIVDLDRKELRFGGQSVNSLTGKELLVLNTLANAAGRAVSKEGLFNAVYWNQRGRDVEIKIIDVFICKLRKKIVPLGVSIKTHWGAGYELIVPGLASKPTEIPIGAGDIAALTYGAR